ncbi:MAG TPA: RcpC/CpaB family pilus assembly protein [Trebonia sp.]|nr:RcpC/CpaB family pilus assembly protein [Trebonia sp.]
MKRRGLTIALAVLLAILGTAGVLVYVNHANARALAGQQAVTVLVAKSLIPSGTTAANAQQQGLLVPERLPAASLPAGVVTAVTPGISALVTDADVQPGQLLLRPMLVTQAQVTNGLAIPKGMLAVTILFCLPEAVAGNIQPGSQVEVFDTEITGNSSVTAQAACTGPHQSDSGVSATTKLILPKVTVLSVGPASASGQGGQKSGGIGSGGSSSNNQNSELVTVAVSQHDAERVIQLTEDGLPYLALASAS